MLRKLFLLFVASFLFVPNLLVFAQTETEIAPEFNTLCWKKKDCDAARAQISGKVMVKGEGGASSGIGFLSEAPCVGGPKDDPWGKCLPANISVTEISFGGKNTFMNLGEFITNNYRLALIVASMLAAVMIVMSGFQWAVSGGNSEVISTAKHHIGGAIIGLFIAYTSFFILNTINPALVNLRLPQTWLLRPQADMPKFCFKTTDAVGKFAQVALATDQATKIDPKQKFQFDLTKKQITDDVRAAQGQNCGVRYLSQNGGMNACFGSVCAAGASCTDFDPNNPEDTKYACRPYGIVGTIVNTSLLPAGGFAGCVSKVLMNNRGFTFPYISTNGSNYLRRVCVSKTGKYFIEDWGTSVGVVKDNTEKQSQSFGVAALSSVPQGETCTGEGKFLGYGVQFDLNSNCSNNSLFGSNLHLVDKNGRDIGVIADYPASGDEKFSKYLPQPYVNPTPDSLFTSDEIVNGGNIINIDLGGFRY